MRIRSIKPEFWSSDDVAALHWHDRLLFIGLWSYVDDNGAGADRIASIVGDLFSGDLETDPGLIFERVKKGLEVLEGKGMIERYECCGKKWLHIVNWRRHQKIQNPSKFFKSHLPAHLADPGNHTVMSTSARAHEALTTGKRGTTKALPAADSAVASAAVPADVAAAAETTEIEATFEPIGSLDAGNPALTGHSAPAPETVTSDSVRPHESLSTGTEEPRNRGTEEISSSDVADATPDDAPAGFVPTQDDELLCVLLLERMIANDQHPRPSKPTKAWLLAANRIHRIDGREPAAARGLLRWAKEPGNFWDPNIKSIGAFREKYDQILAQSRREVKQAPRSSAADIRRQLGGDGARA